jgi:uncharacterized protein (DUF2235 family)
MTKRLAICFDGTWNRPDDDSDESKQIETNVRRLHEAIVATAPGGVTQEAWYDRGVGTKWYDRVPGGTLGIGLSRNVRQGYRRLIESYEDNDEVFIFGFSRGAYTARSLVGLVRKCGVLRLPHAERVDEAYDLYRERDAKADSPKAVNFRRAYSRDIRIRFIGVWDTVGALGVPAGLTSFVPGLGQVNSRWAFHDTNLSRIVDHAYHALALDEGRRDYEATLWTSKPEPGQTVEQRWFAGCHSDVGGGYRERDASDIALDWLAKKAQACGLGFDPARMALLGGNPVGKLHDSYADFLGGIYAKKSPRYLRPVGASKTDTETIDDSVRHRLEKIADYRPVNAGLDALLSR